MLGENDAVALRGAGLHQTNAISQAPRNVVHNHGWLSNCYCVGTPPSALADGWIKFGEPDLPEPARSRLPAGRMEAPRPGRLVLFQSCLWHGTTPFQDDAHRLTVALDVLPA